MINYCTYVEIPKSAFEVSYQDRLLFLGSCFAEQIGIKMKEHGWNACINPYGVLYNPLSVIEGCKRLLQPAPFVDSDLFEYNGMFHSFMHHSKFSGQLAVNVLKEMNDALSVASDSFRSISYLFITLGTAFVYRLKSDGQVVANCHKLPADRFERSLLTVDRIIDEWTALLNELFAVNPSVKVIFTVSPIRHWKDGAHGNQISKSTLLLAEQALVDKYAGRLFYFPAYELMMDELRDYRFYGDDLLHPSKVAVDYLWERFCDVSMEPDTKNDLKEIASIRRDIAHRPFHPATGNHKKFLLQTFNKIIRLQSKNPYICILNEEREVASRLQELS